MLNSTPVNAPPEDQQTPYQNWVHAEGKAVLCVFNDATRDTLGERPERLFWSDLMAACCTRVMTLTNGDLSGLEAIWRWSISNKVWTSRTLHPSPRCDRAKQANRPHGWL